MARMIVAFLAILLPLTAFGADDKDKIQTFGTMSIQISAPT